MRVRLKRSIVVPEEETCFYLFEAQSADVVQEALARSGLRSERVVVAHSDLMPPASPQQASPEEAEPHSGWSMPAGSSEGESSQ